VTCLSILYEAYPVDAIVVTAGQGTGAMHPVRVRRVDRHRFDADVELTAGANRIVAVARTVTGARLRAAVTLDVPKN
jgi:hypothetical protein